MTDNEFGRRAGGIRIAVRVVSAKNVAEGKSDMVTVHRARGMAFPPAPILVADASSFPTLFTLEGPISVCRKTVRRREKSLPHVPISRGRDQHVVVWADEPGSLSHKVGYADGR